MIELIPKMLYLGEVLIRGVFCRARRGLDVGFLLLRCSVLFTVESLSLLYLLVIS